MIDIRTPRLRLRRWTDADRVPFAALNADPLVMAHFMAPLTRAESDATASHIDAHFDRHGFGLWAVEIPDVTAFAGFIGLLHCPFEAHFTPAVEIGWRLSASCWNRGYATEGAEAAMRFAFETLKLPEVVAMTVPANHRSRRVMEKLRMVRDPADDFDHPRIPAGHPRRRHVLYRAGQRRLFTAEAT